MARTSTHARPHTRHSRDRWRSRWPPSASRGRTQLPAITCRPADPPIADRIIRAVVEDRPESGPRPPVEMCLQHRSRAGQRLKNIETVTFVGNGQEQDAARFKQCFAILQEGQHVGRMFDNVRSHDIIIVLGPTNCPLQRLGVDDVVTSSMFEMSACAEPLYFARSPSASV